MEPVDWLIAGLGNPGPRYRNTPHNAGFAVVERLIELSGRNPVSKFDGLFARTQFNEIPVALLTPLTFMNRSGMSVRPAQKHFGLEADRVLVVHDDVELPFGRVRVKEGGGLGGHNGLRSITDTLATRDFIRVRVGIGRPPADDRRSLADWVLAPWDTVLDVDGLIERAIQIVRATVEHGSAYAGELCDESSN